MVQWKTCRIQLQNTSSLLVTTVTHTHTHPAASLSDPSIVSLFEGQTLTDKLKTTTATLSTAGI